MIKNYLSRNMRMFNELKSNLKCIILKGGMHRKRHSTGKKIEI
jgi:hypothetical protein